MSARAYTGFELKRTFRERRLFIFAFGFPVILYFIIAGPNRHVTDLGGTGISLPLYYMVSLASFGTMLSMMSAGFRIAGERQVGWTRQLRITPLSPRSYLRAKVITAYTMAAISLGLLYASGFVLGVRIPAGRWVAMTALIAVALLPFAALGIALGHLLGVEAVGPTIGGLSGVLGFLGGVWFPLGDGVMRDIAEALPSFWLVQASHVSLGGPGWSATGWLVVTGWTAALSVLAAYAYRRDRGRA